MTSEEIYKQQLSDLATAINNKTNGTSAMTVAQMTAAVNSITVGDLTYSSDMESGTLTVASDGSITINIIGGIM